MTLVLVTVLAVLVAGDSAVSAQGAVPEAPDQPIGTAVFAGGVDLEWNDVAGADSYDVQLYRNGQWLDLPGDGVEIAFYGAGAIISGLDPNSTLWFQVRAKNAHGFSNWSNFSSMASTNQFRLGRRARPDNVPASGAPLINGTAQVGESLTADTTGIEDGNGLDRVQFRFQWVSQDGSSDTDIASATDSTYTLAASDEGKTIKVRVAFTDRGGYAESLTGVETEQVTSSAHANPAPTPEPAQNSPATGAPVITGTARAGETLSADTTGIADTDGLSGATFSYQWVANDGTSDTDIQDATASTYTLVDDDQGKTIKVKVSFTDDADNDETLTSTATGSVAARPNSPATGAPTISGTAQVGETLTADTTGIADADGLTGATFAYQWLADDAEIAGATGGTYVLTSSEMDKPIKLRVSFTDDGGNDEILTSAATGAVSPVDQQQQASNTPATGAPTISGTDRVGETLTAETSGIADDDGLSGATFSYQWVANNGTSDTDIAGATDSTYTLAVANEGKTIKVRVSLTDDAGNDETLTSAETATVEAAPNNSATGAPSISGTAEVGETLTADTTGIADADGLSGATFSYQWVVNDGTSDIDITGATDSTYTLVAADEGKTIKVEVSFTDDAGNDETLASTATAAVSFAVQQQIADTTAPTISSIAVTSDPGYDDTYAIGDSIEVTVTFSEDVTVTGVPRLGLNMGRSGKAAEYNDTSGSTVVFSYTVAEGDSDDDGIAISSNRLTLNGGSIKDAADNDADLSHDALSAQQDHEVDGVRPRVSGFNMRAPNKYTFDGVYTIGDRIFVGVLWSEEVSVKGTPQVTLDFNGTSKTSNYDHGWLRGSSEYTVVEGDLAPDGVGIPANATSLNGGSIKDRAGNDTVLTHRAFAADSLYSKIIPVDGIRPTVTSVEIVSNPGDDDTYGAGDEIKVGVTFSENIVTFKGYSEDVDGELVPTIELNIGGEARIAEYYSRSGTTITLAYTVQSGDTDDNGISIEANKVWAGPVTPGLDLYLIRDLPSPGEWLAGNWAYDVSHDAIADDSGHKVDGPSSTLIISGESLVRYWENGEEQVAYYNVSGADGDITWSLSSDDSDDFSINRTGSQQGHLWFQSPPNYEDPTDSDADNEYRVTLNASDGTNTRTWPVVVLVVNALFDADEVPVIVGEARVGETLTVDMSNITYDSTTMTLSYLWERIDGDTATQVGEYTDSSYTLTADDVGKTVRLTLIVLARDFHHLVGEPTAVVSGSGSLNSPATGQPTISGTAQVGETLTASTSGISDTDGLTNVSYSHQWIANDGTSDTDITNATDSTHTLVAADEGRTIKVEVSFTDDAGNEESLSSAVTAAVAARPNTPATGTPTISGTAQVGETLTASTSGIADDDGLTNVSYRYQWMRNDGSSDSDIQNATGPSYTLVDVDEGQTIKVKVTFADDAANEETLTSTATAEVAAGAPTDPPGAPRNLTGIANSDGTVTLRWNAPNDDSVTGYQILRRRPREGESTLLVHVNDTGSTDTEYTDNDVTLDVGHAYRVKAINAVGLSRQSNFVNVTPTQPAEPAQNNLATGRPTISGTAQVGETLTVDTSGIADADGLTNVSYSYQWIPNDGSFDTDNQDAPGSSYTLVEGDEGKTIKVEVSFTDDAGNGESLTSAATAAVAARSNNPATGGPTISGTAQVGEMLTADTSGISDDDGLTNVSYSYQWVANDGSSDTEITDATDSTYTLVAADEGKTIKVRVSFTDDAGNEESLNSAATATIAAAPNSPATGVPAVTGTAQVGQTLTADTYGIADADGLTNVSYRYQWIANDGTADTDITGATDSSYTLVSADEGQTIKVRVSFTDDAGNQEMLTSAPTAVVAAPAQVDSENEPSEWSHLTVVVTEDDSDPDDVVSTFTITWNDAEDCSASYNAYLDGVVGEPIHLGSAASEGEQIAGSLTNVIAETFGFNAKLHCGTIGSGRLVDRLWIPEYNRSFDTLPISRAYLPKPGTYSTEPGLIALTVSSGTLTPAFHNHTLNYTVPDVPNADGRFTLTTTAKADYYNVAFIPGSYYTFFSVCSYGGQQTSLSYSDDAGNRIYPLTDADANTPGFQMDLDEGENVFYIRVWPNCVTGQLYKLTVTRAASAPANTPATGAPTIGGTARVGQPLTADTTGIADSDGLENATFAYQWLADETEIDGATHSTYTLVVADEGQTIKVEVSFTDDADNEETLTSTATAEVAAAAPTDPPGAPRNLTGTANADGTVTLRWDAPNDDSVTGYQILRRRPREGENTLLVLVNDTGSTDTEYTDKDVTPDVGHAYRVKAINAVGLGRQSKFVNVTPTQPAGPAQNSPATGTPTISGTAQVGETLTADTSGIGDDDGLANVTFSYQWIASDGAVDIDITSATVSSYTPVDADEGQTIQVQVSFTDDAGNDESLTSAATAPVPARPNTPATGAPTIGGTAQVGETLAADTSGIADTDGLTNVTYSYQWLGDDTDIAGATSSTYTLAETDEGKTIKVRVSFTDDRGNLETGASAATAVVAVPEPPAKPTGLSAVVSHDTVTLTWDDPQDDTITGYVILRRDREIHPVGTFVTLTGDTGSADTTYTDETVEPDKQYVYRIEAINEHGKVSEISDWVRGFTPAAPVPDKPTGLSAVVSHDTVTLTWDDPQDDTITGYVILRRDREIHPTGTFVTIAGDTGSAQTTYTDDTVEPDKEYVYRIEAINEHGEVSEKSHWVRADTPAAVSGFV